MQFIIKNIGKIEEADITLDGMTIIAGENNVGKSTIGKTVYALLSVMDHWNERYDNSVRKEIKTYLRHSCTDLQKWCMQMFNYKRSRMSRENEIINRFASNENLVGAIEDYQIDKEEKGDNEFEESEEQLYKIIKEFCLDFVYLYDKENQEAAYEKYNEYLSHWISETTEDCLEINIDDKRMLIEAISQSLDRVFSKQYRKIGTTTSSIKYHDASNDLIWTVGNKTSGMYGSLVDIPGVHFIESPKIYDLLSDERYGHCQAAYARYLMQPDVFDMVRIHFFSKDEEDTEVRVVPEESKKVAEYLQNVINGNAEYRQRSGLEFNEKNVGMIHASNVSMGVKSIALLEYALRLGVILDGDILILDEPELNLHPSWQVEYARTLTYLQKNLHLKILVTSHSPYFIRALEVFVDKEGTMDDMHVYRFKAKDNKIVIDDVMESEYGMTELYEDLSSPLQELDKLLEE